MISFAVDNKKFSFPWNDNMDKDKTKLGKFKNVLFLKQCATLVIE